jgi:hypothetical protein
VRCGLFRLEGGRLVQQKERYVPLGAVGNFLNANPVFNLLSERSDAFALLKESLTRLLKGKMVRENLEAVEAADSQGSAASSAGAPGLEDRARREADYATRLTAALYEKLYAFCRERGVGLVIQSIPTNRASPLALVDLFPRAAFDVARPGLVFQSCKGLLDPALGKEPLYFTRSAGHWTPWSHRVCGRALAERIDSAGLLSR